MKENRSDVRGFIPLSSEVYSLLKAVNKGGTTKPRSLIGWRIFLCILKMII